MVIRPFVAQLPPDTFLWFGPRLVGRQVFHLDLAMGCQVLPNPRPPMPARSIHEQTQELSLPASSQANQQGQEPLVVTPRRTHQPVVTFPGRHPAKDIQAWPMVAGRGNPKGLTPSRPHPADPGVFGKIRIFLKHHDVPLRPLADFFLSAVGSAPQLGLAPAERRNCLASADSPGDVATSALGGRSNPTQSVAGGGPQKLARPRPPEAVRAARDSVPGVASTAVATVPSGRRDDRSGGAPAPLLPPPASPGRPNGSNSFGSNQIAGTETSDDNRPTAKSAPQLLGRARLRGPPWPAPATSPGSRRNAQCSEPS